MLSKTFLITLLSLGASAMPLEAGTQNDNLDKRCTWNDGHGDISCGYFSVVLTYGDITIKGNGWEKVYDKDCSKEWSSYTSPLPWHVDYHPGNVCRRGRKRDDSFDNAWIKYADDFVNVPDDTRCGRVGTFNTNRRCIIADKA